MIRVVVVEPGKAPEVREIEPTLETFQAIVGGHIEAVRFQEGTVLYCNEDGVGLELPANRFLGYDIVRGAIVVAGADDEGNEVSLSDKQVEEVRRWAEFDDVVAAQKAKAAQRPRRRS